MMGRKSAKAKKERHKKNNMNKKKHASSSQNAPPLDIAACFPCSSVSFSISDNENIFPDPDVLNHLLDTTLYVDTPQHGYYGTLSGIILEDVDIYDNGSSQPYPSQENPLILHHHQINHIFEQPFLQPQNSVQEVGSRLQESQNQDQESSGNQEVGSSSQLLQESQNKDQESSANQEVGTIQMPRDSQIDQPISGLSDQCSAGKNVGDALISAKKTPTSSDEPKVVDDHPRTKTMTASCWYDSSKVMNRMVGSRVRVVTRYNVEFYGELCGENEQGDLVMRKVKEYCDDEDGCHIVHESEEMMICGSNISYISLRTEEY